MPTLLVVDDEPNVLYSLEKALGGGDLEVLTASTGQQGIDRVRRRRPDAVLLDVRLTDMSGLEAFDRIRRIDPRLPVILVTAYSATETAIEAMKRGAFDYLLKPVDFHQLRGLVARAIELNRLARVPAVFEDGEPEDGGVDRIVGRCPAMQEVYKAVGRFAPQDVTVLILGESGTGKELAARALYQHSKRADRPFLAINCAAIPETLLEAELFGHERGAFTGADRRRIGKFEQADGGTIFLDEIGDMTPATQAKVLRLLQEQRFERLGGGETIQVDVRVIAATNHDLDAEAGGRFRADLLYRLNGFTIRLPPLRERPGDVPLLVEHLIRASNRGLDRRVRAASPEALRLLEQYGWPGNVRELQSAVRYALVHAAGEILTPECLPAHIRTPACRGGVSPSLTSGGETPPPHADLPRLIAELLRTGDGDVYRKASLAADRIILEAVLRHAQGSQVRASELLGISRTTLRAKLKALGMTLEKQLLSEADRAG
ncbi:MAG TPA: sigma-54 dependent transcriptional regulator [Gemmataceae bacterium]|nr:sigma-54 dependent transcriptional regulator [Gemmataceae bacterium]